MYVASFQNSLIISHFVRYLLFDASSARKAVMGVTIEVAATTGCYRKVSKLGLVILFGSVDITGKLCCISRICSKVFCGVI